MKYYYHLGINPNIENPLHIYHAFDRSRTMFDLVDIETLTPIGVLCQPKSIEEMCYNSASNIINKANGNKIFVAWSGGIDSTLILTELLKLAPPDQVIVLLNDNSILEYPDFYRKFIENKLEQRTMSFYSDHTLKQCVSEGVVVTGHITDNLFGEPHLYKVVHQETLSQDLNAFLASVDSISRDLYIKFISGCPRPLINVKDLFWWMNYALSYQFEQLCMVLEVENLNVNQNIFHFCDTADWNNYSVSTYPEEKYPGFNYVDFKLPLKKQLNTFIKDDNYISQKIKVHSWRKYRNTATLIKDKPVYINTEWERGWSMLKR